MNSNIIFFDIDGTIMSQKTSQISDSTKSAIKQAQANGHLAFINTGRTLAEIESEITNIGFDGYVCGCGTYITYHNLVLLHKTIHPDTIQSLIKDLHNYKIDAFFEGLSSTYFSNHLTTPVMKQINHYHAERKSTSIKSFDDPDISVDKFCISYASNGNFTDFHKKYKTQFDFIHRGRHLYEVVPIGYTKATGIQFLTDYLNIPHESTYALGDSSNDLTMLQHVQHSIAMGNSEKEVLELASFITKDVDDNGIEWALKSFNLIP